MAEPPIITLARATPPEKGTLVLCVAEGLALPPAAAELGLERQIRRAAETAGYKGKAFAVLDLLAPGDGRLDRVLLLGLGKPACLKPADWARLGGAAMGALKKGEAATVLLVRPDGEEVPPEAAADFCLGLRLRAYTFDRYKKEKDEAGESKGPDAKAPEGRAPDGKASGEAKGDAKKGPVSVTVGLGDPARAKKAFAARQAAAEGVVLARDLVNEPANLLGPVEFAERVKELASLGVEVEVLTEKEMREAKMGAFLGVAQGSARPPRICLMRWNGGAADSAPLAFVGKGVVFDTGGISMKPAGGMEDMKGDMAGAAAVAGLIKALAGRKARVNVLGAIGIVENMPDGAAQRPGDVVTAMSGQTIEVINTDAEGRLVLADVMTYVQERYKPRFLIDLATLTGAIIVALGNQHAGMFSTDDALAEALRAAGEATGEGVWRMPLSADYDKLIDSRIADVKNVGGRKAGAVTAAQFLKRFVKDLPWVHLDIAGTAMDSPQTEINRSWASGFGVRLLDRMVADRYEG